MYRAGFIPPIVFRRIGGLEIFEDSNKVQKIVFRRIGGLGIICWTEKDTFAIILW